MGKIGEGEGIWVGLQQIAVAWMTQVTRNTLVSEDRSLSSVMTFRRDMYFVFCFPQL